MQRSAGAVLRFGPGVLHAPRAAAPWSSATVSADPGATLGDIVAVGPLDEAERARGALVARQVLAWLVPGAPIRLLAAGGSAAADSANLARLLQLGDAAGIAVAAAVGSPLAVAASAAGCQVVSPPADPWTLVGAALEVHAPAGSHLAVLGLLAGRPVFHDGVAAAPMASARVAAAHLVLATRYVDPSNGRAIGCEAAVDQWEEWRRLDAKLPPVGCFAGISFWKRRRLSDMVGGRAAFAPSAAGAVAAAAARGGGVAVWPSRAPVGLPERAAHAGVPVWRIEDGFIRSSGLGADFIPPCSVVIDRRGIYYDPRQPSDLEHILAETAFAPALLARAARLVDMMVQRHVTKYGVSRPGPALDLPAGRRILVPGQVADDASVLAGGGGVAPGLDLLQRVRAANPDAVILYKPHPDVDAGHRRGAVPDRAVGRHADAVLRGVGIAALLDQVDEVHTLTSLAGFEALLRRRRVVTYGQPFYASWGLTIDAAPLPRRTRRLSLEELVAGALILYPHYIDPVTSLPCGPEALIERLAGLRQRAPGLMILGRRLQGAMRRRLTQARWAA